MEQPVIFLGWGGDHSTDAIFSICPEYIGNRTVAIFFDDKRLSTDNKNVQQSVGSGLVVENIIPESPDGKCGIILMHIDSSKVKDTIKIGGENRNTQEVGCEYAIAFIAAESSIWL